MIEEITEPLLSSNTMATAAGNDTRENTSDATYLMMEFSVFTLAFYAAFAALARRFVDVGFLRKWRIDEAKALDIACKCVSAGFASLAASLGALITVFGDHDPKNAHQRTLVDDVLDHFLTFAMAYFIYDVYAMYRVYLAKQHLLASATPAPLPDYATVSTSGGQRKNFVTFLKENPLINAHHLVIALVFIPMVSHIRNHDPGNLMIAAALIMEASTPFVTLRSVLSDLGRKGSTLYMLNGLVMIVVFFFCRIAVYPLFYKLYAGHRSISYVEALCRGPWFCNLFVLSTLLPQLYWFRLMVRGALKMWFSPDATTQTKETSLRHSNGTKTD